MSLRPAIFSIAAIEDMSRSPLAFCDTTAPMRADAAVEQSRLPLMLRRRRAPASQHRLAELFTANSRCSQAFADIMRTLSHNILTSREYFGQTPRIANQC